MENIDVSFSVPNDDLETTTATTTTTKRNYVLQKYVDALREFRHLAEDEFQVRPYNFDNFIRFHYFERTTLGKNKNVIDKAAMSNEIISSNTNELNVRVAVEKNSSVIKREHLLSALLKIELLKHLRNRRRQILYWLVSFLLALLCFFVYRDESAISGRNVHLYNIMYPSMRMWRRITLPLIQRFPSLTELYDESCLMENPFFQVGDLSCEACTNVETVLDLSDSDKDLNEILSGEFLNRLNAEQLHIYGRQQSAKNSLRNRKSSVHVPFLFKINQSHVDLNDFYNIYKKNRETFRRDAYRVQSTNTDITNLDQMFQHLLGTQSNDFHDDEKPQISNKVDVHNTWRCNRMLPARLLRPTFAPHLINRLPGARLALERFLFIDTAQAPSYTLPDTECANVYIEQLRGERFIILRPTSECRHQCRTLSIRLPPSFVLSYNWWYWKPISTPDPAADSMSISLIGSYC